MAVIRRQRLSMGNRGGEEDFEAASVGERGYSYVEESRSREDKDDRDRARTKAERGSHASEGNEIGSNAGRWSRKERGVRGA
jgi:hypothetical protein